ncbi:TPA: hypothetical protein ACPYW1_004743 [Citrobacter freundii]
MIAIEQGVNSTDGFLLRACLYSAGGKSAVEVVVCGDSEALVLERSNEALSAVVNGIMLSTEWCRAFPIL